MLEISFASRYLWNASKSDEMKGLRKCLNQILTIQRQIIESRVAY
jgi:hypothetical protein